ncbi:MAG: hypothetical protein ABR587_14425 [Candidatus Binatia bacterium]
MSGLLETAASLGVSGAVMVLMTTSLTGASRVHSACVALGDELFAARQLEHLVDRAALAAGAGPGVPSPIASVSADTVVFASDHDGDGSIDTSSSETTALEVRQSGAETRVRLRLGRQTMTILAAEDREAALAVLDNHGLVTDAASAALVELSIAGRGGAAESTPVRRMLFSVAPRPVP